MVLSFILNDGKVLANLKSFGNEFHIAGYSFSYIWYGINLAFPTLLDVGASYMKLYQWLYPLSCNE